MYRFYIETFGCQMNVLDSELAGSALTRSGMIPAENKDDADVILFNTCSVRKHAEDKVFSELGRLKPWKDRKPYSVLGVLGCMAQKEQKHIFQQIPFVDLVLGPGALNVLSATVLELLEEKESALRNKRTVKSPKRLIAALDRKKHKDGDLIGSFQCYNPERRPAIQNDDAPALVRIMFGCNQFCSYCIVPYVRGPEQSRPVREIIEEVKSLTGQGIKKITFIGQTVNSYQHTENGKTVKLADLLEQTADIAALEQIDFVTNYPKGMDDRLLQAVRDLPKVVKHLHVPAQSGADTVLKRMNRHYTAAEYRELTDKIYSTIPGATMMSDFIVGFCGETDEEFEQTADLVKYCRFRNSFIFKYSVRAGTKAAELYPDDVPEAVKKARNNRLLDIQKEFGK